MNASQREPGKLKLQANGRWAIDEDELTSGAAVEIDFSGVLFFKGRIEHNGKEYYFAWPDVSGAIEMPMQLREGLRARRI